MLEFNPYVITLSLFTLTGLVATVYGWTIIAKAKRTKTWPSVEGTIEESKTTSEENDLLPYVEFSYTVDGRTHRRPQEFPKDLVPGEEFRKTFAGKYPCGARVPVYYDPAAPEHATLEPGFISGDWMVFAFGLGMAVIGIFFLLSGIGR